jgi:hypothetical protein
MKWLFAFLMSVSLMLASASCATGDDAAQTDWSGGDRLLGPVVDWQDRFAASSAVDWAGAPGTLILLQAMPVESAVTTSFNEPAGVTSADIDGDLDLDIAAVAYQGDEVAWWENDGSGGGWTPHTIATGFNGACSLCAIDLDQDGDIDVAATAETAGRVTWFENEGGGDSWTAHVVDAAIAGPYSVCPADFDGDGDWDLCGAAYSASRIVWWENTDGLGTSWTRRVVDASFNGAWWAVAEDVDADGHTDIVGAAYGANLVSWWENDGTGMAWTEHAVDNSFSRPISVRTADMDGDDDVDVVGASNRGRIAWWENDGAAGGWLEHEVDAQLNEPFGLRVADLDGDGDPDVISNERAGNRVMWYENTTGTGRVWLERTVDATCSGPNDVLATDVDGDQQPEVVATFSWDNSIVAYEPSSAYAGDGTLDSSILDAGSSAVEWGSIDWDCAIPPGTSVSVEVRASNDATDLGDWIPVASSGDDLSAYVADGTRYMQYRVALATTDGAVSPGVEEIRIAFDPTSAVDEGEGSGECREARMECSVSGNPCASGAPRIRFTLPQACRADLALYDAGGRRLATIVAGARAAGEHAVTLPALASGVYLYRLSAGGLSRAGKLVVR